MRLLMRPVVSITMTSFTFLPAGQMCTNAAVAATERMRIAFPSLKHALLGIAGGDPSDKAVIRLGDLVVGQSDGQYGESYNMMWKDATWRVSENWVLERTVTRPTCRGFESKANLVAETYKIRMRISDLLPSADDVLFQSSYDHVGGNIVLAVKDILVSR
ncbi:uncharacterized protein BDW70DRAFT_134464 [Aspergillus foveolatus]|uniref:uncharacterized protein n=1 Tax=Aspergillus foveolatus TaxID=210207 RepID=UPI003CCD7532